MVFGLEDVLDHLNPPENCLEIPNLPSAPSAEALRHFQDEIPLQVHKGWVAPASVLGTQPRAIWPLGTTEKKRHGVPTGQLRTILHLSWRKNGPSFNDRCLPTPDFQNPRFEELLDMIRRFEPGKVWATTFDLEAFYSQVSLRYRDSLYHCWRSPISGETFVGLRVSFGGRPFPFLMQRLSSVVTDCSRALLGCGAPPGASSDFPKPL
jgi:hypothetical protein